jgi:hypothetical protein
MKSVGCRAAGPTERHEGNVVRVGVQVDYELAAVRQSDAGGEGGKSRGDVDNDT